MITINSRFQKDNRTTPFTIDGRQGGISQMGGTPTINPRRAMVQTPNAVADQVTTNPAYPQTDARGMIGKSTLNYRDAREQMPLDGSRLAPVIAPRAGASQLQSDTLGNPNLGYQSGSDLEAEAQMQANQTPATAPVLDARGRLAQLQAEENALLTDPINDKNGRWKSGLKAFIQSLGNVGRNVGADGRYGWENLIGDLAASGGAGLGGVLNKKWDEYQDNGRELGTNRVLQARASEAIKSEDEQIKLQNATIAARAKANSDIYNTQSKASKDLFDVYNADDVITEDEAKDLQAKTGRPYSATDNRKFKTESINGVTFSTPEKGAPSFTPTKGAPIDRSKVRTPYKLPSGEVVHLSDSEKAEVEIGIQAGNVRNIADVKKFNITAQQDYEEAQNKFAKDKGELDGVVSGASQTIRQNSVEIADNQTRLKDLESRLVNMSEDTAKADRAQVENDIKESRSRIRELQDKNSAAQKDADKATGTLKNLKAPTRPNDLTPTVISKIPTQTEADLRKKGKASGLSDAQIEQMIADSRNKGIIR